MARLGGSVSTYQKQSQEPHPCTLLHRMHAAMTGRLVHTQTQGQES
jgi:hypothetical protein